MQGEPRSGCQQRERIYAHVHANRRKTETERERERECSLKCTTGFSSLEGRSRALLTLNRPTAPGYDVSNVQCAVATQSPTSASYLIPRSL